MTRFDFAGYDHAGRQRLLVDVKRRLDTTAEWARGVRQNVLHDGQIPLDQVFALIVPERLYLWNAGAPLDAPPTHDVDAVGLLAPYFRRVELSPQNIDPMAFELLVSWWLNDLARGEPAGESAALVALRRSGLVEAIAGGQIIPQVAA